MEIAHLREQLSQLRVRDERPGEQITKSDKEQVTIQARISDKELEKKRMYQELDRLRELRKQKESATPKRAISKRNVQEFESKENSPKPKSAERPSQVTQSANLEPISKELDR